MRSCPGSAAPPDPQGCSHSCCCCCCCCLGMGTQQPPLRWAVRSAARGAQMRRGWSGCGQTRRARRGTQTTPPAECSARARERLASAHAGPLALRSQGGSAQSIPQLNTHQPPHAPNTHPPTSATAAPASTGPPQHAASTSARGHSGCARRTASTWSGVQQGAPEEGHRCGAWAALGVRRCERGMRLDWG